jgi:hypothetical protein
LSRKYQKIKIKIEFHGIILDNSRVQVGKKQPTRSEAQSLDSAINGLVKGLKRDIVKKYGRLNYSKLRKDGFSEGLLTRLQQS